MFNKKLIKILKQGGVAGIPTDTIYGLVASVSNPEAVDRVYHLKNRAPDKPCIILISSLTELKKFGITLNQTETKLLAKLWPGPVSIIFSLPSTITKSLTYLHRSTNTLSFRLPKSTSLRSLLKKTGPLIAPSANQESARPASTIKIAKKYFSDKVDFYIAGGKLAGKPSTLVALQAGKIIVVRHGVAKLSKV